MGIKGLWKELQPVCKVGHITQLKGMRVGIDAYCWLHRAAIASSIALSTGQPCEKFIQYFVTRVDMLLHSGVSSLTVVFDGDAMPMKKGTDDNRKQRRLGSIQEGLALLANHRREEAARAFERGLDITPEIAFAVIQVLQERDIECIVAPYEADAQLGYLLKEGYIQAVISEDSDLVVYNATLLVAKMDFNGNCDVLRMRDLPQLPSLSGLSRESFVIACILAGCDYLPSLHGVGIKTALKIASSAKGIPATVSALAVQGFSQRELSLYEESFHRAYYCFAHHLVVDPQSKTIVHFTPLPQNVELREDILGEKWGNDLAIRACLKCEVDPTTKRPYTGEHHASVELYRRKVRDGQRSLTSVGVEIFKSETRRLPCGPSPADVAGVATASQRPIVLSKYFQPSLEADGMNPLDVVASDAMHSGQLLDPSATQEKDDKTTMAQVMAVGPRRPLGNGSATQQSTQSTVSSSGQGSSCGEDAVHDAAALRDLKCPHRYPQCNTVHSIFVRCFEGKGWEVPPEPRPSAARRGAAEGNTAAENRLASQGRATATATATNTSAAAPAAEERKGKDRLRLAEAEDQPPLKARRKEEPLRQLELLRFAAAPVGTEERDQHRQLRLSTEGTNLAPPAAGPAAVGVSLGLSRQVPQPKQPLRPLGERRGTLQPPASSLTSFPLRHLEWNRTQPLPGSKQTTSAVHSSEVVVDPPVDPSSRAASQP